MLTNHLPLPGIVLNQHWDVINANSAAQTLFSAIGFTDQQNIVEAMIRDRVEEKNILNWQETAKIVLLRLRQEISALGSCARLEALEKQLVFCLSSDDNRSIIDSEQSVLSVTLQVADEILSFFSIIAELGSIQHVAVSEFKVELMFPADEKTINYYKNL